MPVLNSKAEIFSDRVAQRRGQVHQYRSRSSRLTPKKGGRTCPNVISEVITERSGAKELQYNQYLIPDVEWARQDSNLRPSGYEPPALTTELQAL